ncbi:MAG: hypothetical protein ACI4RN_00320 [Oscillospiraceae bacterium]
MYQTNFYQYNQPMVQISNNKLWYIALLPLVALFAENFAVNKWLGIALWTGVIAASIAVTVSDEKDLRKMSMSHVSLYKSRFFPPLYIYRRQTLFQKSKAPFIVLLLSLLLALGNNGFVSAMKVDDSTFISSVQNSSVSNIEGFSEYTSTASIENRIKSFSQSNSINWQYSADNNNRYVSATGYCGGKASNKTKFKIVFKLDFDGYKITELSVDSCYLDGAKLSEKDQNTFLYKVFIQQNQSDDNESNTANKGKSI